MKNKMAPFYATVLINEHYFRYLNLLWFAKIILEEENERPFDLAVASNLMRLL